MGDAVVSVPKGVLARLSDSDMFPYIAAFFITIASVLGTGILGLPVKLAECGFWPFIVTYSIGFAMQSLAILFLAELLQRTHLFQLYRQHSLSSSVSQLFPSPSTDSFNTEEEMTEIQLNTLDEETDELNERKSCSNSALVETSSPISLPKVGKHVQLEAGPDLHAMGIFFLPPYFRRIFDAFLLLHFFSILISYCLAGSQAYAQLLGISFFWTIAPFALCCTLFIIFGSSLIRMVVSVLTAAKGSLLVGMVAVTAWVAFKVDRDSESDWSAIGQPFLIGTVALGGAGSVLPIVFSKVQWKKDAMQKFVGASIGGLFMVFTLNVLWCYYILKVVPQEGADISLKHSEEEGEIATVPLIDIIEKDYSEFKWIGILVQIFIILSISVSYVTLGSGLKHVMDGFVKTWKGPEVPAEERQGEEQGELVLTSPQHHQENSAVDEGPSVTGWREWIESRVKKGTTQTVSKQVVLYTVTFGGVYIVAQSNPKSFLVVLEVLTSLALNLQSGYFITTMLANSRLKMRELPIERDEDADGDGDGDGEEKNDLPTDIPFPVPKVLYHMRWVVVFYFLYAVIYDVFLVALALLSYLT